MGTSSLFPKAMERRDGSRGWTSVACLICAVLAVPACSSSEEGAEGHPARHLEDLTDPVLIWDQGINLCGRTVAIDGLADVYVKEGCEDGNKPFPYAGHADEIEVSELWQDVQALPAAADRPANSCLLHQFGEQREDVWHEFASVCGTGERYDDLSGLAEPYAAVARRFLALPP